MNCSRCEQEVPDDETLLVDDQPVCRRCLHGEAAPILMYPIGYVREGLPEDAPHGAAVDEREARIELFPSMRRFITGLQEERYLTIVWVFDRSAGVRTVFNRRDGKVAGIFSSRSPNRLNPIAVTEVELVRVEGTTLYVRGLDAFEGSPVLDLKSSSRGEGPG